MRMSASSLFEGLIFDSWEEVDKAIVAFGKTEGFFVRIRDTRYTKTNHGEGKVQVPVIKFRKYVCSREGYRQQIADGSLEGSREKSSERCGCGAHYTFSRSKETDHMIVCYSMDNEHNHPMLTDDQFRFHHRNRSLPEEAKAIIANVLDATPRHVDTTILLDVIKASIPAGEKENINDQDVRNYINKYKYGKKSVHEAHDLLFELKKIKDEDPLFFYEYTIDAETKALQQIFWMSAEQRKLYVRYHDVVVFDTTFKTNSLNMPLGVFVAIDNRWESITIGGSLTCDETIPSFEWVFRQLLKAVNGVHPRTIFTDEDNAMSEAILSTFPQTQHRLCIWHLNKNYIKNLGPILKEKLKVPLIQGALSKFAYDTFVEKEEWERKFMNFKDMLVFEAATSGVGAESMKKLTNYVDKLFLLRYKWAKIFNEASIHLGVMSTQRSESINSLLKRYTTDCTSPLELFRIMEQLVYERRQLNSSISKIAQPVRLSRNYPILKGVAVEVYQPVIDELEATIVYLEANPTRYKIEKAPNEVEEEGNYISISTTYSNIVAAHIGVISFTSCIRSLVHLLFQ